MPKRVTKLRKRIFIELRLSVDAKIYLLLVIIIHCIGLNNHNWYYQSSAKYSSAGFSGGKTTAKGKFSCHHSSRHPKISSCSGSFREPARAHTGTCSSPPFLFVPARQPSNFDATIGGEHVLQLDTSKLRMHIPRGNPQFERVQKARYDIGNACSCKR
eukprot:gb/GECG01012656.1/.p1 GENE.gb/GECG01012656.1/~~gb/GECG01012656.1/.p1  ORF type:complete len:158 (+),score=10.26 gb/GECG01012656.1/:1-474(+)